MDFNVLSTAFRVTAGRITHFVTHISNRHILSQMVSKLKKKEKKKKREIFFFFSSDTNLVLKSINGALAKSFYEGPNPKKQLKTQ